MMKTTLLRKAVNGLLLACLLLLIPSLLRAGSGQIVPAPANGAGIRGLMNFSVNFRFVPTAADVTAMQNALRVANDAICDATDGQIVFGTVTITAGAVGEAQADIWVLPDPGRSGVSFMTNGSSFGRLGDHITLFSDGINGRVIAHELGHLAFGLGDEYDEQCRWGGPCGIGPAIDPANVDDRNNTLMANHNTMSELTVAANHDPLRGDGSGCPTTETCPGMGLCTGDSCNGFNGGTGRYEASQHTLIHGGRSDWEILQQNYPGLGLTIPALPTAAVPASCDGFLNFNVQVDGSSLVVLVFDRSGSMSVRDVGDRTRLEFAQAAGRAFVDLQQTKDINLGIVEFSSTASTVRAVQDLTPANATPFKNDINGLFASGNTAIGDGLIEARVQLQIAQAVAAASGETLTNPTVFLLSDGQNNRGADPDAVAQNLISAGVTIHSIPVGNGADTDLLADLASESGGQMLPAYSDDMIPAIYAELAAHQQGYSLINAPVKLTQHVFFEFPSPSMAITLPVEHGAEGLTIFLGLKKVEKNNIEHNNISRSLDIIDPNGNPVPDSQYEIYEDAFYRILRLKGPIPGSYQLFVSNNQLTSAELNVVSFVENPLPDFYIDAIPSVLHSPAPVKISGTATYGSAIFDPSVRYEGVVIRPDNSTVPVSLSMDPFTGALSTDFTAFNGTGSYKVLIGTRVPRKASLIPGESIFDVTSEYQIDVEAFNRLASTSFVLFEPGKCPPCGPDVKDCDGDGIPNDVEDKFPDQDIDGDGLPNSCDEDSDGDDIPDSKEGDLDLNQNDIPDAFEPADGIGCKENTDFRIEDIKIKYPDCGKANGLIAIKVKGAKGKVTYKWYHDPKLNKAEAGDLRAFIYSVTVIDESGCERNATINLTENCTVFEPSGDLPVTVSCPGEVPQNCEFPVTVTVNMNGSAAPNDRLGSFTAVMSWDPAKVAYVGPSSILSGFSGYINLDATNGRIVFNGANTAGMNGVVNIFRSRFQAIGPVGSTELVKVEFLSFAAANTFVDLKPELALQQCAFKITLSGLLGDVNGDGLVTSTDGNIILSSDVGLSLPPVIQDLIDAGFGDVNQDGATNATDALIVLSYDAQFAVPYPVGESFCANEKSSDATGLNSRGIRSVDMQLQTQPLDQFPDGVNVAVVAKLPVGGNKLGSYKAVVSWDPQALEFLGHDNSANNGMGEPVANKDLLERGRLILAGANPEGLAGEIKIFELQFARLTPDGMSSLRVSFENMAAATTFEPLQANWQLDDVVTTAPAEVRIFPNPFTDKVQLVYDLPQAAHVQISVHNLVGQQLAIITSGTQEAGTHRLDWQSSDSQKLPSGLLLFKIKMGDTVVTKKVMYMGSGR